MKKREPASFRGILAVSLSTKNSSVESLDLDLDLDLESLTQLVVRLRTYLD